MITRLGASGVPRSLYGSFSGKAQTGSNHPVDEITRLGASGTPRQRYGSFAGKSESIDTQITRLGASAIPRQRYGSFSGKAETIPVEVEVVSKGHRRTLDFKELDLERLYKEDEELLLIAICLARTL